MLQDIFPHVFHNEMSFIPPEGRDLALVYSKEGVLCRQQDGLLILPTVAQCDPTGWVYAFSIDDTHYYLAREQTQAPGFDPCSNYRELGDREGAFACAVGQSLYRWYSANRFCGCCGQPMEHSPKERAMVCPHCSHTVYPKICPAVIVAVCDGDRLLLTKYAGRAFTRYALVAGFCEIGETVEDCVRREVMEETGLHVGELRFYKSQPWVITDSLLMGFFCRLEGSDQVKLQEDELCEGTWFNRGTIPGNYSGDSLTGEMIQLFRDRGAITVF